MSGQGYFNFVLFNSLLVFVLLTAIILWRKPSAWLHLFSLFLGIVVGWWDLRVTEVSFSVLMLVTLGMFAGFQQPKRFWLWAIYLGMWVPILSFLAANLHITNPTPVELATSFLAVLFALAGALAGALLKRFAVPTIA